MDIKEYIRVYDDVLDLNVFPSLMKWLNSNKAFETAKVVRDQDQILDKNTRDVEQLGLSTYSESLTNVHWCTVISNRIFNKVNLYKEQVGLHNSLQMQDLICLRYENAGHYNFHTDSCTSIPRTLTTLLMLNNDYEGGELCFKDSHGKNELCLQTAANRLVIFPSNFMYPHAVKPVSKGVRFSIVSWLL